MSSGFPDGKQQIENQKGDKKYTYRDYIPYLSLGFQLAVVVVIFFFLGDWIDRRYGITPVGKLVGGAIGMIGGFINFFRSIASLISDEERKRLNKKP